MLAIAVENLSKRYRLGTIERKILWKEAASWLRGPKKEPSGEDKEEFWALKDINFEIPEGQTVGIIGANGAGKSTLLKILSKTTSPTTGTVRINGRVGSLLEVGTGFNPEMTGRENVYLNGSILGMQRGEIDREFDNIVSFAGVEKFIDTPVKRYSSGMYVRLAFSVTSFLQSEILIVDEVLSVGDQQFQNKCIGRLQEIIAQGRTVLFVSHGAGLIRKICSRAICLKQGVVICDGEPNLALDYYQDSQKTKEAEVVLAVGSKTGEPDANADEAAAPPALEKVQPNAGETIFAEDRRPGDDVAKILSCKAMNLQGEIIQKIGSNQEALFQMTFRVFKEGYCLRPGANVYDELGNALFWTADPAPDLRKEPMPAGDYSATFVIPKDFLAPGLIIIGAGVGEVSGISHAYAGDSVLFLVEDDLSETSVRGGYNGPLGGFVRPRLDWKTAALPRQENRPVSQSCPMS